MCTFIFEIRCELDALLLPSIAICVLLLLLPLYLLLKGAKPVEVALLEKLL